MPPKTPDPIHSATGTRPALPASGRPQAAPRIGGCRKGTCCGFTLVELLITIAVLGVLAAILIPQLTSDLPDRLQAGAQVVASDIDYARALAVAHGSKYRVAFDPPYDAYYLHHSGDNPLFHVLPPSPFGSQDDPPDRQTTKLSELPLPQPGVRLVGAVRMTGMVQPVADVEFEPLGGTTSTSTTVVWLACGHGAGNRFISVSVDPVTGLTEIGPVRAELPSAVAALLP